MTQGEAVRRFFGVGNNKQVVEGGLKKNFNASNAKGNPPTHQLERNFAMQISK